MNGSSDAKHIDEILFSCPSWACNFLAAIQIITTALFVSSLDLHGMSGQDLFYTNNYKVDAVLRSLH